MAISIMGRMVTKPNYKTKRQFSTTVAADSEDLLTLGVTAGELDTCAAVIISPRDGALELDASPNTDPIVVGEGLLVPQNAWLEVAYPDTLTARVVAVSGTVTVTVAVLEQN